jgi:hypothetical protein
MQIFFSRCLSMVAKLSLSLAQLSPSLLLFIIISPPPLCYDSVSTVDDVVTNTLHLIERLVIQLGLQGIVHFVYNLGRSYSQVQYLQIKTTSQVKYLQIKATSQVQ